MTTFPIAIVGAHNPAARIYVGGKAYVARFSDGQSPDKIIQLLSVEALKRAAWMFEAKPVYLDHVQPGDWVLQFPDTLKVIHIDQAFGHLKTKHDPLGYIAGPVRWHKCELRAAVEAADERGAAILEKARAAGWGFSPCVMAWNPRRASNGGPAIEMHDAILMVESVDVVRVASHGGRFLGPLDLLGR